MRLGFRLSPEMDFLGGINDYLALVNHLSQYGPFGRSGFRQDRRSRCQILSILSQLDRVMRVWLRTISSHRHLKIQKLPPETVKQWIGSELDESQNFPMHPIGLDSVIFLRTLRRNQLTTNWWAIFCRSEIQRLTKMSPKQKNQRKFSTNAQNETKSVKNIMQRNGHFSSRLSPAYENMIYFMLWTHCKWDVSRLDVVFLLMTGFILHFLLYLAPASGLPISIRRNRMAAVVSVTATLCTRSTEIKRKGKEHAADCTHSRTIVAFVRSVRGAQQRQRVRDACM